MKLTTRKLAVTGMLAAISIILVLLRWAYSAALSPTKANHHAYPGINGTLLRACRAYYWSDIWRI